MIIVWSWKYPHYGAACFRYMSARLEKKIKKMNFLGDTSMYWVI